MAGAWTLLQVLEYFGETYAWPRAVRQIAGLALPLGLLFVLVLAWYHGDKGDQRVSRPEVAILATLVAFVGGTLWWYVPRIDESAWVADTGVLNTRHALTPDAASIAVLPFLDMSPGKDQEYLADGMSEEVLNLLSQLPQLHVIARTSSFSFMGKEVDIATIATKLNVAHVLEGSVRKSGDTVRVTAQLIRASDSTHLWSQTYDRKLTDVFIVQDEIARAHLGLALLWVGRQQMGFVPPVEAAPKAKAAALRAVEFDDTLADAHYVLAIVYAWADWNWPSAEREFRRAIELNPRFPDARAFYADFLVIMRRPDEAMVEIRRALELDPNNGLFGTFHGDYLARLHEYDAAIAEFNRVFATDPTSAATLWSLFAAHHDRVSTARRSMRSSATHARRATAR